MQRRTFFRQLLSSLGVTVAAPTAATGKAEVLIQRSPLAGFQFHNGESVWSTLSVGENLKLEREPNNPNDRSAVAVYRDTDKLGYLPRGENNSVSQMLDRGEHIVARICQLRDSDDPWKRIQVSIVLIHD